MDPRAKGKGGEEGRTALNRSISCACGVMYPPPYPPYAPAPPPKKPLAALETPTVPPNARTCDSAVRLRSSQAVLSASKLFCICFHVVGSHASSSGLCDCTKARGCCTPGGGEPTAPLVMGTDGVPVGESCCDKLA